MKKDSIENSVVCFCCGKTIDSESECCPYCGAEISHLDTLEHRNPYTKRVINSDGVEYETNNWIAVGAMFLLLGIGCIFYVLLLNFTIDGLLTSLAIAGISVPLFIIGAYRKHLGKKIVRKENDEIREIDPDYSTEEDQEDVWDKVTNKLKGVKDDLVASKKSKAIKVLKGLVDDGVLTEEEYEKKKKILENK